jgi:hypothetical protein
MPKRTGPEIEVGAKLVNKSELKLSDVELFKPGSETDI